MNVAKRGWSAGWLALPVALALVAGGCGGPANGDAAKPAAEKDREAVRIPVQVASVELGPVSAAYEGTATLEARREATVVARTSGLLLDLKVEEGDRVEKGQVLARLDAEQHRLEVAQAKATLDRLQREFKRTKELHEKKLVSADEFERVRSELEAQQAAYDMAKLQLSYTEITAPIKGVISTRLVKEGNWIQEQQPLYRIDDFQPLEAKLHVPERELSLLESGYPVSVTTDAVPGQSFHGSVARISPVVDPDTGTFDVTVSMPNEDGSLKPGLFVRARIVYDQRQDVPLIPRTALLTEDGMSSVFVVEEGVAHKRDIQVGYDDGHSVEVASGLEKGQQVVTIGQNSLRDGTPVDVVEG